MKTNKRVVVSFSTSPYVVEQLQKTKKEMSNETGQCLSNSNIIEYALMLLFVAREQKKQEKEANSKENNLQ